MISAKSTEIKLTCTKVFFKEKLTDPYLVNMLHNFFYDENQGRDNYKVMQKHDSLEYKQTM